MNNVDPQWGWNMVLFLVAVIGVTASVMQMFAGRRSQKREVNLLEEFATRKELQALTERVEDKFELLRTEIAEDKNEMMKAGEARVIKVHDRINDVLAAVSELKGEVHSNRRGI